MKCDLGFSTHPTLAHALLAAIRRTYRTWRYARSIGADPTVWWGVYERGTEHVLAATGPLPDAERRARKIIRVIESAHNDH
jgi:hypothetical protein